jgi:uncharacterized membrane protein
MNRPLESSQKSFLAKQGKPFLVLKSSFSTPSVLIEFSLLAIVQFKHVCLFSRLHLQTLCSWNELVYTIALFVFLSYLIFVFLSL